MANPVLAWHFLGYESTFLGSRVIPPDGELLRREGKIVIGRNGLPGSEQLIDALGYATGPILCRTKHTGTIERDIDGKQLASSECTILWRLDATDVLRAFARRCALDVAHLWDMPEVVRRYLETGDKSLWIEASAVAWDAACGIAHGASAGVSEAVQAAADAASFATRDQSEAVWVAAWRAAYSAGAATEPHTAYSQQSKLLTDMVEAARRNISLQ